MSNKPQSYTGRKILVLGLGRSGVCRARLLRRLGSDVMVCDISESDKIIEQATKLRHEGIQVLTGYHAEKHADCYDLAIVSPGIDTTVPFVSKFTSIGIPLIGELELAYSVCICPIIAITGTNGKTTTTELTTQMLQGAGWKARSCGNIGMPMSELLCSNVQYDVLVVEVSSFQLESIVKFRPKVAVWLNLSPNHLDRYSSMDAYRNAKMRIFENQQARDWAVVPNDTIVPKKVKTITFGNDGALTDLTLRDGQKIFYHGEKILDCSEIQLRGAHNMANLMAAFGAGIALDANVDAMALSIKNYTPPAHRCEFITKKNGVSWINDSKATNMDAMEQAIRSVTGHLLLIAGGKDKGIDFLRIAPLIHDRVSIAILIGEMRYRILHDWTHTHCLLAENLKEAVILAHEHAVVGSTVLFSPGTSSFDMFDDYIARGETFRSLVENLP